MRTTTVRNAGVVAMLAVLAAVLALGPDTGQAAAPIQERIIFSGEGGIRSVSPNGADSVLIAPNVEFDSSPRISPDGARIVFVRGNSPLTDIWVMDADGSNQVNLTNDAATDGDPAWSPDGTKIAFWSSRSGGSNIWVMDADGSSPVNLTSSTWVEYQPAWSPDGETIVYSRQGVVGNSAPFHLWSVDSSGGTPADLTPASADNIYSPAYSPDGSKIAVIVRPASGDEHTKRLYEMALPGGQMTQRSTAQADNPRYSPDGTEIVYGGRRGVPENYRLYVLDQNGTETMVLDEFGTHPDWGVTGGAGPGNVDGSGSLDAEDIGMMLRSIGGIGDVAYPQYANVDCDGDFDIYDVVALLRQVAGVDAPSC